MPSFHALGSRAESSRQSALTLHRSAITTPRCPYRDRGDESPQKLSNMLHQQTDVTSSRKPKCLRASLSGKQQKSWEASSLSRARPSHIPGEPETRSNRAPEFTNSAQHPQLCILSVGHTAITRRTEQQHYALPFTRRQRVQNDVRKAVKRSSTARGHCRSAHRRCFTKAPRTVVRLHPVRRTAPSNRSCRAMTTLRHRSEQGDLQTGRNRAVNH